MQMRHASCSKVETHVWELEGLNHDCHTCHQALTAIAGCLLVVCVVETLVQIPIVCVQSRVCADFMAPSAHIMCATQHHKLLGRHA